MRDPAAVSATPGFGSVIATVEISGTYGLQVSSIALEGSVSKFPFTGEGIAAMPYKATGDFSLRGTVDAATGAVTGTFKWNVPDIAYTPWDVTENPGTDDAFVAGQMWMNMSFTWSGDVTGTIGTDTAELVFSGPMKSDCTTTYKGVGRWSGNISDLDAPVETETFHNCTGPTGAYDASVTFTVTDAAPTTVPAALEDSGARFFYAA